MKVTAQWTQRPGKARRWAYVLHLPNDVYMSAYRYGSEVTALRAGLADGIASERIKTAEPNGFLIEALCDEDD